VYFPIYRQVNALNLLEPGIILDTLIVKTPREDVFSAFDYYLKNVNKGERPFIIFGHSQGAHLTKEVVTVMLGHPDYAKYHKNLIAAYSIGYSVTSSELAINSQLKFSQSKDDLGVVISYNSTAPSEVESKGYENFGT